MSLAVVAAAALCGGPAAAGASAGTVRSATYDVAFEGVYHYDATEGYPGIADATRTVSIGFAATTAQPLTLSRAATSETAVVPMAVPTASVEGHYHEDIHGEHPDIQDCTLVADGTPTASLAGASTGDDGAIALDVQPFDVLKAQYVSCAHPVTDPSVAFLGRDLSARAKVPATQVGDASIVIPVENDASLPCPSYAGTYTCEASWTGRLTLTRRSVTEDPPPAPPKGNTTTNDDGLDGVVLPPLVLPKDDDLGIELPPLVLPAVTPGKDIMWNPSTGTLDFDVLCTGGCTGTATLRTTGAHVSAAAAQPAVRFTVAANRKKRHVRLVLPARTRVALRRAHRGTLTITLRDRASHRTTSVHRTLRAR